ncbi:helicase-related protein [uncultured Pontibacter sp.]|uniref:helicase-related protein n=1 Tax=uncultured Pontibacter sp. TaxID=453356 RepID=UPI002625A089|nr:helicase-related protein [uncultured Pontibacter sp.]
MSRYLNKREELVATIQEQTMGPGANGNRYVLLSEWDMLKAELREKDLKKIAPLENQYEVMDEVPAYYYGTGILFPPVAPPDPNGQDGHAVPQNTLLVPEEFAGDEVNMLSTTPDTEIEVSEQKGEALTSANQNYPTSFGLSFAVKKTTTLASMLDIKLDFRTYSKITGENLKNIGVRITHHEKEIEDVIKKYFSKYLDTEEKDDNLFVRFIGFKFTSEIDRVAFEHFQHSYLENEVWNAEKEEFTKEIQSEGRKLSLNNENGWTSRIRDRYIARFQSEAQGGQQEAYDLELIKRIEVINEVRELLDIFKVMHNPKKSTFWKSAPHSIPLTLEPLQDEHKRESGHKKIEGFEGTNNNVPVLSLHWQYLPKGDKVYVKLIIKNDSTPIPCEPNHLNKKDEANIVSCFGIQLSVTENGTGIGSLIGYNPPNLSRIDNEDNFNKLLYRQYIDLGEGYNTSVRWGKHEDGRRYVSTEFLPTSTTPQIDHTPSKLENEQVRSRLRNEDILNIKSLSTLSDQSDQQIIDGLTTFVGDYEIWIKEKYDECNLLESEKRLNPNEVKLLKSQLDKATTDKKRLLRNIKLLKVDSVEMAAFRLMNTAMFMQMHHALSIKEYKKNNIQLPYLVSGGKGESAYKALADTVPGTGSIPISWRPFQLAFVLLNIDAFIRPGSNSEKIFDDFFDSGWHERNDLADLVWFPTGGGKTEAYLGIMAFFIAYRRFTKGEKGYGTAILMRYTLRLLTLQQFQRATLLICALEHIRKEEFSIPGNSSLGKERITIGLYVGKGSLPNTWEADQNTQNGEDGSMEAILKKIATQIAEGKDIETKLPHTECPWCGSKLFTKLEPTDETNLENIEEPTNNNPLKLYCNEADCSFENKDNNLFERDSLPLRLFDEDIYKAPPTLLFGTVDKFAQLAFNVENQAKKDSRRIFGRRSNNGADDVLPPELIIQDELHLLLGPLGSAVGLFETVIDNLCSYTEAGITIRPKVITSTATTRNTDKQIYALFDRKVEIFPKAGIDCDDSFFAYYKRDNKGNYLSTRKYMGILPVGKTQVWMQLRIAAVMLAHRYKYIYSRYSTEELFNEGIVDQELRKVCDYYHTMLMYFNSLKEVGKTESQLYHYLPNEVSLVKRNITRTSFFDPLVSSQDKIEHSELTGRLSGEEVKSSLSAIERNWELQKIQNPPEFVIATNMISVGIDVSRFNTMVISSMPRNIAEYIQASSRVARDKEGLVVTVHHPFRSRDISHYQKFVEFHEKFYGYVEPISVTPYTQKALERYLSLFLATWIRHKYEALADNNRAGNLTSELKDEIVAEVTQHFSKLMAHSEALGLLGILDEYELGTIESETRRLMESMWYSRLEEQEVDKARLKYSAMRYEESVYTPYKKIHTTKLKNWNVKGSLREVAPETVIKTVQQ